MPGGLAVDPAFRLFEGTEYFDVSFRSQNLVHAGSMVLDLVLNHKRALCVERKGIDLVSQSQEVVSLQIKLLDLSEVYDFGKIGPEGRVRP